MFIKKILHPNEFAEYIEVQQRLRKKQLESSYVFMEVKKNPKKSTGDDAELHRINTEADMLALRLIELREIFEPAKTGNKR